MPRFIEPLEGRTLLTATSTSIASELAAINTAATAVKTDMASLKTTAAADLKTITTDLKGSPKTNAPLLKKLGADEKILLAKINTDVNSLLKGSATAAKGAADGTAAAASPTSGALANKVQGDVNKLATVSNPLTKLQTDANDSVVSADLANLGTANPSISGFTSQVNDSKTRLDNAINTLLADAKTYSNALGSLKTDLTTLLPAPTTSPSLIGDYQGTVKTKAVAFGLGSVTEPLEINVTGQTINTLTGSITVAGHTASGTITVKELTTGNVTMTLNDSGTTVTLTGKVNVATTGTGLPPGSVISGSGTLNIAGFNIKGDFTVTKVS
jgi:hypothetical protein